MSSEPISLRAASTDELENELRREGLSPAERAAVQIVFTQKLADDIVASLDLAAHAVPAGWHPDPVRRYEMRYWNGRTWTSHVSNRGETLTDPAGAP